MEKITEFVSTIKRWIQIRIFRTRRAGFYIDLGKAIQEADSLKRFLRAGEEHLLKYKEPGQAALYAEMLTNLNQYRGKLAGMTTGLVPESDLLSLAAIDNCSSDAEKHAGLRWMAKNIKALEKLRGHIIQALAILPIVIPIAIGILVYVSTMFVPLFEQRLSHEFWSPKSQVLYWVSYSVTHWHFAIVIVSSILGYLYQRSFTHWRGISRRNFEQKIRVLRIPHVLHRDHTCATYFVALANLLRTKVPLSDALVKLSERAEPYLYWHIQTTLSKLKERPGKLIEAFDTGLIAPDLFLRLSNFSAKKGFELGLIDLAESGMEHIENEVIKTSKYLYIGSIAFVAFTIGFLYFGVMGIAYDVKNHQEAYQLNNRK
jgi:hypothetical protein